MQDPCVGTDRWAATRNDARQVPGFHQSGCVV